MATILETLQNVDETLSQSSSKSVWSAQEQLQKAIKMLQKGYPLDMDVESVLAYYDMADPLNIPDYNTHGFNG